jgi:hypothetical protein
MSSKHGAVLLRTALRSSQRKMKFLSKFYFQFSSPVFVCQGQVFVCFGEGESTAGYTSTLVWDLLLSSVLNLIQRMRQSK